ncbi:hypothetical protein UREG_04861 [Uncinocarpus reesii 1704]|uniref:DUF1237 domain-containing protein n=1 Tax=Uncinocarpus reesii (strain UAMH 1704) TaxID=336963 RepID=C4JUQ8_UNCRE|nr:uncharacterized protein UREG_04861 [Uncinocarpus reesii 1704]EEP80019.1 hypothetical protein UREG_04861 [Uncinocarpus reesii 1704]
MKFSLQILVLLTAAIWSHGAAGEQEAWQDDQDDLAEACPDYTEYAARKHPPYSEGPLKLPFQRPASVCRTFTSPYVEKVIEDITTRMVDKDLARIFQNAFPNTLDTTVRWHVNGSEPTKKSKKKKSVAPAAWEGPQSFIVTGDINAEWLRDSTNQLAQYQVLSKKDPNIKNLILGAINTQAEFVIQSPYCNAFQPPPPSKLPPTSNGQDDTVHPAYEPSVVFECKYELDSLANFLSLGNQFYENSGSDAFITQRWYQALDTVLKVVEAQSQSTFDESGRYVGNEYTFQRTTNAGTETLNLRGIGNPLNSETGLVRSAFRPSDDASIMGFFIPANAMMSVELKRTADTLQKAGGKTDLIDQLRRLSKRIEQGVWEHGVVKHKTYGDVFAFEVDGYGSHILMDDANLPSLLSLPLLGFLDQNDKIYQNTRKMILSKNGNPYYLTGSAFHGIGGPHIGVQNAWPMSVLVRARTADNDEEITESINMVRDSSLLGLIHESVNVNRISQYTRSWFAWANSVFAQTILDLAARKPHLIFGENANPYRVADIEL